MKKWSTRKLNPHMLDGMGRRLCRSCKAVWPCDRHPLLSYEAYCNGFARVWVQRHKRNGFWHVNAIHAHNAKVAADLAPYPSVLRAMAAALGYTIDVADNEDGGWAWTSPSMSAEGCADTADEAARAACEHHARTNGYV